MNDKTRNQETNEKLLDYLEKEGSGASVQIQDNGYIQFDGFITHEQLQDIIEILGLNT